MAHFRREMDFRRAPARARDGEARDGEAWTYDEAAQ